MAGETQLHKTLKKEACRWMNRSGYRCIAAEVRLPPLGIIDAVGTGYFRPYHNYLSVPYTLPQTVFVEAKASRADFLRDMCERQQMLFALKQKQARRKRGVIRGDRKLRGQAALGKFRSCLLTPMANLHYVIAPAGLIKKKDLPPRWGLLTLGEGGVAVTVRADWVETGKTQYVESAIARTLTGDIFRADDRAIGSLNREIATQQHQLAERIKALAPIITEQMEGSAEPAQPTLNEAVRPARRRAKRRR